MVKFGRNVGMAVIHRRGSDSGNVYGLARVDFDGRSIGHMPVGVIVGGMNQFKMVAHTMLPSRLVRLKLLLVFSWATPATTRHPATQRFGERRGSPIFRKR